MKPGYKQTEVGALPADWDAGPIGRAVERLEAGASVNSEKDEAPDFDSYPCVLKTGAAREGSFDPRESKKVARRDLWRLKVSLRKDTILVSRMNTVELVGESGYVDADYPNLFVPDRMWMTTIWSTGRVHPRWLSYILTWQPVKSQISASATGTSGSMKNISKPSFRAVEIPYPPVEEQRAIAEALSDADALIASLEQLLAKKRQLKQGAMQELLTGKKRLPGFSGEWEVKQLGALAVLSKGSVNPASHPGALFTHFSLPAFDDGAVPVVEVGACIGSNKFLVPKNAVLLSKLNPRLPRIWAPAHIRDNAVCSTEFLVLVPSEATDRTYLAALCSSPAVCYQMELHAIGTTGSHQRIHPLQALAIEVNTPRDKAEQTAIATILSDMDAEIAALEAKMAKARQIKQGMMQELLTGRIRLPCVCPTP